MSASDKSYVACTLPFKASYSYTNHARETGGWLLVPSAQRKGKPGVSIDHTIKGQLHPECVLQRDGLKAEMCLEYA